jgi:hypothetical protein
LKHSKAIDIIDLLNDNGLKLDKKMVGLERILNMQMDRSSIRRFNIEEDQDDGYVEADRADLMSMVWDITKDAWVFVRGANDERRLQRDVGKLIRGEG